MANDDWAEEGVTDILPNGMQVKHGELFHPAQVERSNTRHQAPEYQPESQVPNQQQTYHPSTHGYYRTNPDTGQPEFVAPTKPLNQPSYSPPSNNQYDLYPTALKDPSAPSPNYSNQYFDDPLQSDSYGAFSPPGGTINPPNLKKKHPVRDGIGDGVKIAFGAAILAAAIGGIGYGAYKLAQAENRRINNYYNNPYYYNSYSPYGIYNTANTPYHWVRPHIRNGRAVGGYFATNPDGTLLNNYSTVGNVNPWTGQPGYIWP